MFAFNINDESSWCTEYRFSRKPISPNGCTNLIPKPAIGHGPELVQSVSHPLYLFP
jgi:hypothetical protein